MRDQIDGWAIWGAKLTSYACKGVWWLWCQAYGEDRLRELGGWLHLRRGGSLRIFGKHSRSSQPKMRRTKNLGDAADHRNLKIPVPYRAPRWKWGNIFITQSSWGIEQDIYGNKISAKDFRKRYLLGKPPYNSGRHPRWDRVDKLSYVQYLECGDRRRVKLLLIGQMYLGTVGTYLFPLYFFIINSIMYIGTVAECTDTL